MSQGTLFDRSSYDGAVLSGDRLHRFRLWRYIDGVGDGGRLLWIMLNPSTADETANDLTIKKCIGFGRRWGMGEGTVDIVNLFSYRATDPSQLWSWMDQHWDHLYDLSGARMRNDETIMRRAVIADKIVVAWGAQRNARFDIASSRVIATLTQLGISPWCLGTTKDGHPRHPSRLGYTTKLVPYVHRR